MPYELHIFSQAEKQLAKIAEPHRTRLIKKIRTLKAGPRPFGCEKLEDEDNLYRVRVGDYRIIYSIDDSAQAIIVTKVASRGKAYGK